MDKYYKADDVINTLADLWQFEQEAEYPDITVNIEEWRKVARKLFADLPSIEVNENNERSVYYEIGYEKGKQSKCDGCCQYKIGFEDGKLEMIQMVEDALKKRGGE